jgi:hypothetical protein
MIIIKAEIRSGFLRKIDETSKELGGLKLQMRHIKIYDIKINNLL